MKTIPPPTPVLSLPEKLSIAIAAPSSVPFVVGGAEKLWWGLQDYINQNTGHHCELIKVCAPEESFGDLIGSYDRFYRLDLRHFDLLLTTKYPAWMVRHVNHHVYFQHPLRGLYELYRGPQKLSRKARAHPGVKRILDAIEKDDAEPRRLLDDCLEMAHDRTVPEEALALPGPLIRRIVRALDRRAMNRVQKISAISRTVRERDGYFPDPEAVRVIHHPSNLRGFSDAGRDYLLTASRLVRSKRIHLILEAYLRSGLDIPLKIAGCGSELPLLQKMAAGHPGVHFTGFVSDRDLVELYSRALAVVFVPENEDLGLITLEAMSSGKPVITTVDSGGAAELVQEGRTGWVCAPTAADLGRAMREATLDPEKTAAMGGRAARQAREINWARLFTSLFASELPRPAAGLSPPPPPTSGRPSPPPPPPSISRSVGKPGLAVLSTFPVYPPRGGGQSRIYHLYRTLTEDFEVHLVCFGSTRDRAGSRSIAPGLRETRLPMPEAFLQKARRLSDRLGIPAVDLAVSLYPELLPDLAEAVAGAAGESELVVLSHPYTLPLAAGHARGKLIYEAHNVEYDLKRSVVKADLQDDDPVLQRLAEIEAEACRTSLAVMACSRADLERLNRLYGLDPDRAWLVPNGVDTAACVFTSPEDRAARRRALGLENSSLALFLGSYHPPNIQAVGHILDFAGRLPDYQFIIVGSVIGSVADDFQRRSYPENVGFAGEITEAEKALYLACAGVALNPVSAGSGTNLKMLEYIAAGIPVVSTPFGARGLDVSRLPVLVAEIENFAAALEAFDDEFEFPRDLPRSQLIRSGRAIIEQQYSWQKIGRDLSARLLKLTAS